MKEIELILQDIPTELANVQLMVSKNVMFFKKRESNN